MVHYVTLRYTTYSQVLAFYVILISTIISAVSFLMFFMIHNVCYYSVLSISLHCASVHSLIYSKPASVIHYKRDEETEKTKWYEMRWKMNKSVK